MQCHMLQQASVQFSYYLLHMHVARFSDLFYGAIYRACFGQHALYMICSEVCDLLLLHFS